MFGREYSNSGGSSATLSSMDWMSMSAFSEHINALTPNEAVAICYRSPSKEATIPTKAVR